jgi:hypothetical protein
MSAEITNPTTDQIIASALRLPAADRFHTAPFWEFDG